MAPPLEIHGLSPTPGHVRRAGIAVVHQQPHLIPDLRVMENLALRRGFPRSAIGTTTWPRLEREGATAGASGSLPPRFRAGRLGEIGV